MFAQITAFRAVAGFRHRKDFFQERRKCVHRFQKILHILLLDESILGNRRGKIVDDIAVIAEQPAVQMRIDAFTLQTELNLIHQSVIIDLLTLGQVIPVHAGKHLTELFALLNILCRIGFHDSEVVLLIDAVSLRMLENEMQRHSFPVSQFRYNLIED